MLELVLKGGNSGKVVAVACSKCRLVSLNEAEALRCCKPNICGCGKEVDQKYYTSCDKCMKEAEDSRYAKKLEKTNKINEEDYTGGMVFSEEFGNYYLDIAEYLEDCEHHEVDPEEYVWGCNSYGLKVDAADIAENATTDHHEDAYNELDLDSLQKVLNDWCLEQDITSYEVDYRTAIKVDNYE